MRICPSCRPIRRRIRNRPGVVPLAVVPAAGVAQLVEQLIRNQQVRGSSPRAGSKIDSGGFAPEDPRHASARDSVL